MRARIQEIPALRCLADIRGWDELVVDRIVAEAQGNPLALLELPRGMTPAELAGGFGLPGPGTLTSHVEQIFARRVGSLPPDSGRLMLIAAAEPLGDVTLLWHAAEQLSIGPTRPRRPRRPGWSSSTPGCGSGTCHSGCDTLPTKPVRRRTCSERRQT